MPRKLESAAKALEDHLRGVSWYEAVGQDAQGKRLILYVNRWAKATRRYGLDGWLGFEVDVKRMGKVEPA